MRALGRRGSRVFTGLILFFLPAVRAAEWAQRAAPARAAARPVQFRNAVPGVAYVSSRACAECHADIYENYLRTDMGRSMSLASERREVRELQVPIAVKHARANVHYQVYREGADLYQSEYALDADGKKIFRNAHKIEYLIGSGANGFGGIVRRGNFLFEAPLSYYSKAKVWGLSPGYEYADYAFNRPVEAKCASCHSGRPRVVENHDGMYETPPFKELSIGCENCHGPGALHIEDRRKGVPLSCPVDRSIVNPAKLPGWLADNICMFCHQGTDARTLMPGKNYSDFRPGKPLAETMAIFAVPLRREASSQDPLLQHYVLMSLSRCYLKSRGRMSCITCHNPHRQPSPAEAPAYFRAKCLACHTEKSCALPFEARIERTPPDDCAGCHMPKQNLQVIAHSALTNHRIIARAGEALPKAAFHQATPGLADLVLLDAIPGGPRKPLPPATLLRAYAELMQTRAAHRIRFDAVLAGLAKVETKDAFVLSSLGRKKFGEPTRESQTAALNYLERALEAGSTEASDFELLASLRARFGKTQEAIATLKRGLELNPYSSALYRALIVQYVSIRGYDEAYALMKKEIELFPEDAVMRKLIRQAEAGNPN